MGAGASSSIAGGENSVLSPPEALERKEAGNSLFANGNFRDAEYAYTEAIGIANDYSMQADGQPASPFALATLWSNRSAARQKLEKFGEALADALIAITLRPRWGKGYWRAGVSALSLEQHHLAREYLSRALALTPATSSSHETIANALNKAKSQRPVGVKDGPGCLVTWGLLPSEGCHATVAQSRQSAPRIVAGLRGKHIVDVSCGAMHTVAVSSTGVYAWGNNTHGQCGIGLSADPFSNLSSGSQAAPSGSSNTIEIPQLVPSLIGIKVTAVSCGSGHSCVIDEGGILWSWGISGQGQLGLGADYASRNVNTPTANLTLHSAGERVTGVSCGIAHTAVLTVAYDKVSGWNKTNPALFAFGWNRCGQLGLGLGNSIADCVHTPTRVTLGFISEDDTVQQIACGGAHTLLVTNKGRLYATGSGSCGQLGLGSNNDEVSVDDGANESSFGPDSTVLSLLSAGKKMMREHEDVFEYRRVKVGSEGQLLVAFACAGEEFSCIVVKDSQDVYAFGLGNAGQCGNGTTKNCIVPTLVEGMSGKCCVSMVSGKAVTRALTEHGDVWEWGGYSDASGEGDVDRSPDESPHKTPRKPSLFSRLKKRVRQLEIGRSHYAALLYSTSPQNSYIHHLKMGKHGVDKIGDRIFVSLGKKYKFSLQAVDDGGEEISSGCDQFHVRSRHASSGEISFAESVFDDNFDGTYSVSVKPSRTGLFVVEVQLHGVHVSGSPFELAAVGGKGEETRAMVSEDKNERPAKNVEPDDKRVEDKEMTKRRLIMARLHRQEMTRRRAKEALERERRIRLKEEAAKRRRKKQKRCGGGFVVHYKTTSLDEDDVSRIKAKRKQSKKGGNSAGELKSAW